MITAQISFGQTINTESLKNGDLIFVGAEKENLSGAINRVTQRDKNISFDHIGLIEMNKDTIFVLHASAKQGSIREEIHVFYDNQKTKENNLIIYRLKSENQKAIPQAIHQAKEMLGKPYNWSYILQEDSYYCSDFIERAFRTFHIFQLEPMTFINPATGKTDEFWIDFYHKQNLAVPEGKLGCNPNGLAASDKLTKVAELIL
ncbi:hypothetical protein LZQ00_09875 [Sphingobacterium sp. SRCM116780]|uniref:YiiX/YebB-like N1pC/P60 family cysteine hydrolase n=1 Tax=Sphingobacterium sp. SRCM116780 TaxID=2907623 RepID=UPI001F34B7A1|nr:YiiX/YebB-like N1pC/P60 family cysteine hydrolase [Sphingobacterium sp. SRCM116780]UIR54581.1 hypothetical protein LZQ00_09875 [Sphingobacterium sp. SRCM116780]